MTETITCNTYTVWVGGSEVNDTAVTEAEAWQLARNWLAEGYDDVALECLNCGWHYRPKQSDMES